MAVEVVAAPEEGVWRVGREPDLLSASVSTKTSRPGKPNTGNRFDSPTGAYGVRYFASDLDGCYGETLARFRADKKLAKVIGAEWSDLGFMNVGDIPADWRQRRGAIRVRFPASDSGAAGLGFLDIESLQTREALLPDFEPLLKFYGYADLDVAVVRATTDGLLATSANGPTNRLTRTNAPYTQASAIYHDSTAIGSSGRFSTTSLSRR